MAGTLFMSPVDVVGKVVRQSGVSALGQTVMFKESDCVVDRYQLSWLCVVLVQRAFQFAGLAFFRISKAVLAECATAGVARVPTGCRCICRSVRNVSSSGRIPRCLRSLRSLRRRCRSSMRRTCRRSSGNLCRTCCRRCCIVPRICRRRCCHICRIGGSGRSRRRLRSWSTGIGSLRNSFCGSGRKCRWLLDC